MNRDVAPKVWWSRERGLMWSDDGERSYRRIENGRVVEFLVPPHPDHRLRWEEKRCYVCDDEAPVMCQDCADMPLEVGA